MAKREFQKTINPNAHGRACKTPKAAKRELQFRKERQARAAPPLQLAERETEHGKHLPLKPRARATAAHSHAGCLCFGWEQLSHEALVGHWLPRTRA